MRKPYIIPISIKKWKFVQRKVVEGETLYMENQIDVYKRQGIRRLMLPYENLEEVALLEDIDLYPVRDLRESMDYYLGLKACYPYNRKKKRNVRRTKPSDDFCDVVGQEYVCLLYTSRCV